MATHSSILAWRIPWTEEPGRVHGSQRVLSICKQELYNNSVLFLLCNGMLPHYKLEVPYTTEKR